MSGGDREALRSLVQSCSPWLYPVARRLAGGDAEAGELLAVRLFVEVWRLSPCYDHNLGPPMAWMLLLLRQEAGVVDKAAPTGGGERRSLVSVWFGEEGNSDGD